MLQTVSSPRSNRQQHPPANQEVPNLNEFEEILQAEVYVDVEKLRDGARHGIPAEIRGVCQGLPVLSLQNVWSFACET